MHMARMRGPCNVQMATLSAPPSRSFSFADRCQIRRTATVRCCTAPGVTHRAWIVFRSVNVVQLSVTSASLGAARCCIDALYMQAPCTAPCALHALCVSCMRRVRCYSTMYALYMYVLSLYHHAWAVCTVCDALCAACTVCAVMRCTRCVRCVHCMRRVRCRRCAVRQMHCRRCTCRVRYMHTCHVPCMHRVRCVR